MDSRLTSAIHGCSGRGRRCGDHSGQRSHRRPAPGRLRAGRRGERPERTQLTARLELAEPVGNEIFLNLRLGSQDIVARVAPQAIPTVGEAVRLAFQTAHKHLFDAASERRIGSLT